MNTVLTLTLSGSALALVLMALRYLLVKKMPSTVYYYAWLLVLLRFLLPLPGFVPTEAADKLPVSVQTTAPVSNSIPHIGSTDGTHVLPVLPRNEVPVTPRPQQSTTVNKAEAERAEPLTTAPPIPRQTTHFDWRAPTLWLTVWAVGAVIYGGATVFSYLRFMRSLRRTLETPDTSTLAFYDTLPGRKPTLYCCRALRTPLLCGLIRPRIILPVRDYNEELLNNVLRHELMHFRRRDTLYKWFSVFVLSLHWFNPVIWLVRREINRACELSCDEMLLRGMTREEKQSYGNTLLNMAASSALPSGVVATTFSTDKKHLKERLETIMRYKKSRTRILAAVVALALLASCGIAAGPAGKDAATGTAEPTPEATAEPVLPEDATAFCREFLEIFLTSDYEGRYTEYKKAMEAGATGLTMEEAEQILAEYHASIRPYISDELYDKMLRNRDLTRWDQGAEKLGVSMVPIQISVVDYGSDFYDFEAVIQLTGKHNCDASVTGRVTINDEDLIESALLQYYEGFPSINENSQQTRETAAGYFRQYYTQKAETELTWDVSYMDLMQIDAMVSSTSGVVVDTEELTIEVLGAMFSGNTAEIALLVTANELESVWNDDEEKFFTNFKFADTTIGLAYRQLEEEWCLLSHQYAYSEPATPPSDTQSTNYVIDKTLAPNQFVLWYTIVADKLLELDTLSIPLQDFARFGRRGMSAGRAVPLYEGTWQVDIAVDPSHDNSKRIAVNREIQAGEYRFSIENIQLTPFTCVVHLTCLGDDAYIDENADAIFQTVIGAREDFTLHFADGTRHLLGNQLSMGSCEDKYNRDGGSYHDEYQLDTVFDVPIAVEDITSITMFGQEFPLK